MLAQKGRPRIFVTQAEKQKAYRERKRQTEVLRNSSGSILSEPAPLPFGLAEAEGMVIHYSKLADENRRNFMTIEFTEWNRKCHELQELWWKYHQAWYAAWIEAGHPGTPYSLKKY